MCNKWRKYILLNGGNVNECKFLKSRQIGRNESFKLDDNIFNFVSKSSLSQAYFVMDKILPVEHNIFRKRKYDVLKPVPCFEQCYPKNIDIFGMNRVFINPRYNSKVTTSDSVLWEFFTDGSCMPNLGPGGSGYYSIDFDTKARINPINHDTTINYCELDGIRLVIQDCLNKLNRFAQRYQSKKYVNIYTDSQFVIDQLDINGYPQYQYYYQIINQIYKLLNHLNNYNVNINIIKIPSHIGIKGNQIADTLAKQAAIVAHNCKYKLDDIIDYSTYFNPINVDISKDIIWLNKFYKNKRKNEWLKRQFDWKNNNLKENQYVGDMIMQRFMVTYDGGQYKVRNISKQMRNQLKFLKQFETEIIIKLRSEYINLNGYKNFKFDDTNGKCIYCNVEETVEHFLMRCKGSENEYVNYKNEMEMDYNIIRAKFRKELRKISIFFKEEKNFNILNILFPQIWQREPKKTNPHYREIKEKNIDREVQILKCVVRYVQNTKRFKKEKFGY